MFWNDWDPSPLLAEHFVSDGTGCSCWNHWQRTGVRWRDVWVPIRLATVLGCADDEAQVAQIVVVIFCWNAGGEFLELLKGFSTAFALRCLAWLIHARESWAAAAGGRPHFDIRSCTS